LRHYLSIKILKFIEKKIFSATEIKEILDALVANRRKVKELVTDTEKQFQSLDKMIRKQLIAYKWKPEYNEKAIYIDLESQTASHLWFVESWPDVHRFKEAPSHILGIHDYRRQQIKPEQRNFEHAWVLPLTLFKELQVLIPFEIQPDKYARYNR
jgi:hypothetical protein